MGDTYGREDIGNRPHQEIPTRHLHRSREDRTPHKSNQTMYNLQCRKSLHDSCLEPDPRVRGCRSPQHWYQDLWCRQQRLELFEFEFGGDECGGGGWEEGDVLGEGEEEGVWCGGEGGVVEVEDVCEGGEENVRPSYRRKSIVGCQVVFHPSRCLCIDESIVSVVV